MRDELRKGKWLTDEHMNLAQSLLKDQFPHIDGLQTTVLSEKDAFVTQQHEALQIHFVAGNHWVTSSSFRKEVALYDSKYSGKLHPSLTHQLARIYWSLVNDMDEDGESDPWPELVVKIPEVQQQRGACDCGVFAVAFALHVALRDDPQKILFEQSQMRPHLLRCFENWKLEPFPHKRVSVFHAGLYLSSHMCTLNFSALVLCQTHMTTWWNVKSANSGST